MSDRETRDAERPRKKTFSVDEGKAKAMSPVKRQLEVDHHAQTFYNRLEANYHLSNKKALYYNMKQFCEWRKEDVFSVLPLTFHIKEGLSDPEYAKFTEYFTSLEEELRSTKGKKC